MATITMEKKSLAQPDEIREVPRGLIEIVYLGELQFSRTTFYPGWRWSESVKPIAGTESCEFHHLGFVVSGRKHVRLNDGTETDVGAGDVVEIAPGHDAWVVGDEALVMYDFGQDDRDFAKTAT